MVTEELHNVRRPKPSNCLPAIFNRKVATAQMTVVAFGMFRGGTTMLSDVLDRLGVNMMPDGSQSVARECVAIRSCLMNRDWRRYEYLIQRYNAEHNVWGYKYPGVWETPRAFNPLRNPVIIVSHRDPVAIVTREAKHGVKRTIRETLARQNHLMEVVNGLDLPTLHISHERGKEMPSATIHQIVDFLGIKVTNAQITSADQAIDPSVYRAISGSSNT